MKHFFVLFFVTFSLARHQNFILVGPPGSGKGTFSSFMKEHRGYYHICPGDILRAHIRDKTELGKKIKPIVERGDYIDDQVVFEIIKQHISECLEKKQPFIIDGFPRNNASYDFLTNVFKEKKIESHIIFVHFQIDNQICIDRIEKRLFCFSCSGVFNTTTRTPKESMICDQCGSALEARLGDNTNNTVKRLDYFRNNIEPLINRAKERYPVLCVNAEAPLEKCLFFYKQLLQSHLQPQSA